MEDLRRSDHVLDDVAGEFDGKLDGAVEALSDSLSRLYDAALEIGKCLDDLEFNQYELELVEDRLFAIRALARFPTPSRQACCEGVDESLVDLLWVPLA